MKILSIWSLLQTEAQVEGHHGQEIGLVWKLFSHLCPVVFLHSSDKAISKHLSDQLRFICSFICLSSVCHPSTNSSMAPVPVSPQFPPSVPCQVKTQPSSEWNPITPWHITPHQDMAPVPVSPVKTQPSSAWNPTTLKIRQTFLALRNLNSLYPLELSSTRYVCCYIFGKKIERGARGTWNLDMQ